MLAIFATRRVAMSLGMSMFLVGYSPRQASTGPMPSAHAPPRLRACSGNLRAESATRVIGPAGGAIRFGDNALVVPAGALDSAVSITAATVQSPYVMIDLEPRGLQFNVPAHISLGYRACPWDDSAIGVVYLSDDLTQVLEQESASVYTNRRTVEALISHFSVYAIAEGNLTLPAMPLQTAPATGMRPGSH
jgi:hypothetical protein